MRDGHPGFDAHVTAGRMHDSGSWSDVQIEGEKVTLVEHKTTLFFLRGYQTMDLNFILISRSSRDSSGGLGCGGGKRCIFLAGVPFGI